ncbi:ABC transporter substrate-binding protein [Curtobacterium sp. Csp1]|uniref:ABC transporter substrate-binding protein n=1 Tax=Curtobacterium sp. Csp1 TaxID=2495429 RepID=UPI0020C7005B|nr:extracellular solute-binding protein [Curtobacterium sp. Csp1]
MSTGRRRTRALVGAAVVAVAALTLQGCAIVNGSGDDPNTLRVMMGADTTYPKERKQWQQETAAEFERTTGARIQWETYSSAQEELTAIQTSVISGQGPDVYAIGTTFTPTAYATGAFVEMGSKEWRAVGGKDQFDAASLGISGPSASKQIGIPFASRPFVMAVNKDLLAQAGITDLPTTWDELTADAKATTRDGHFGMAIAYADGFRRRLEGGDLRGRRRERLPHLLRLGDEGRRRRPGRDRLEQRPGPRPVRGRQGRVLPDDDHDVAEHPQGLGGRRQVRVRASILSGDNLVVADYGKKQDLSFDFVKQVSSPAAQERYFELFGQLPTNTQAAQTIGPASSRSPPPSPARGPTSSSRSSTSSCSPSRR